MGVRLGWRSEILVFLVGLGKIEGGSPFYGGQFACKIDGTIELHYEHGQYGAKTPETPEENKENHDGRKNQLPWNYV